MSLTKAFRLPKPANYDTEGIGVGTKRQTLRGFKRIKELLAENGQKHSDLYDWCDTLIDQVEGDPYNDADFVMVASTLLDKAALYGDDLVDADGERCNVCDIAIEALDPVASWLDEQFAD